MRGCRSRSRRPRRRAASAGCARSPGSRQATVEQASAELVAMAREYERAFPACGPGWTLTAQPLEEAFFGGMRQPLFLLQTAVALVLLIACANLAALILTRAVSRQREL